MKRLAEFTSGYRPAALQCTGAAAAVLPRLAAGLRQRGVGLEREVAAFFVPGRIEVVGKHTDYAGGRSLVAATERGIWLLASPRRDRRLQVADLARGSRLGFDIDAESGGDAAGWSVYPRAVARRLLQNLDRDLRGADIALMSTLPLAAGLSSSSALIIATFLALARCNGFGFPPRMVEALSTRERLASYLGAVENGSDFGPLSGGRGVGTRGGDQDHTAILCCSEGRIHQYAFLPTRLERSIALPPRHRFVIAVSGVRAVKTGDAKEDYNRAAEQVRDLIEIWNRQTGHSEPSLAAALSTDSRAADRLQEFLLREQLNRSRHRSLSDRLQHFMEESEWVVPGAGAALERGDLQDFGAWVDRSQELATRLLANQVDETIWLAAAAREHGALAATSFGAGFGGAVWALVAEEDESAFLSRWSEGYRRRFPARETEADFFITGAGGPAVEL